MKTSVALSPAGFPSLLAVDAITATDGWQNVPYWYIFPPEKSDYDMNIYLLKQIGMKSLRQRLWMLELSKKKQTTTDTSDH